MYKPSVEDAWAYAASARATAKAILIIFVTILMLEYIQPAISGKSAAAGQQKLQQQVA